MQGDMQAVSYSYIIDKCHKMILLLATQLHVYMSEVCFIGLTECILVAN